MTVHWWAGRIRQFGRYVTGRVSPGEREALRSWLTPAQLELFEEMHRADQRHGLDVVAALRRAGHSEPDLMIAGLLHDCGKGRSLHIWHRVAWSLFEPRRRIKRYVLMVPTFRPAFATIAAHANKSAEMAVAAGCSPRTADLIRHQDDPNDAELGVALKLADEAS
jgi:hypothetical protein